MAMVRIQLLGDADWVWMVSAACPDHLVSESAFKVPLLLPSVGGHPAVIICQRAKSLQKRETLLTADSRYGLHIPNTLLQVPHMTSDLYT